MNGGAGGGVAMAVATLGGVGRLPLGPGTWGSALALPLALLGPVWCFGLAVALSALGWWATRIVLATTEDEDPGWIVVDEGAGMLLALAALPAGASALGVALAFGLFRAFDIAKPWPVSWADRQPGATGVMLDDLVAGALVALILVLLERTIPGVFTA